MRNCSTPNCPFKVKTDSDRCSKCRLGISPVKKKCDKEGCLNLTYKKYCRNHSKKVFPCQFVSKTGVKCSKSGRNENYCSIHLSKSLDVHANDSVIELTNEEKIAQLLAEIERLRGQ